MSSALASDPPDFGPVNPPRESVEAGHTERVVKDILHVGRHKIGYGADGSEVFWDVTPDTLNTILADFQKSKQLNVVGNLGKTHGDDNLLIHPDDLIAPIDDLRVHNGALWMASYVRPEDVDYLKNPARKVSPAFLPNHLRAGYRFANYLTHVAVTDRPVQGNQAPFMALADAGGGTMDFAALVEAINGLLEANGMGKLPEDVSEVNIVDVLKGVQTAMGKTAPAETEAPADTPDMGGGLDMSGLPAPMADFIRKQSEVIKQLSDRVTAAEADKVKVMRDAFAAKAGELQKAGVVKSVIDGKIALADRLKCYDVTLLDGLQPQLNKGGGVAAKLADATAPSDATDEQARRKEVAESVAKRRGIKMEDALKLVP